jgi:hypothetical protein
MKFDAERRYTIKSLEDFLAGAGGAHDWDAFTSTSSKWPELERIRKAALFVDLPLDENGRQILERLLAEARSIASR